MKAQPPTMIPEELAPPSTVRTPPSPVRAPPSTMNVIAGAQRSAVGKESTSATTTEEVTGGRGDDPFALSSGDSVDASGHGAHAHVCTRVGDGDARTEGDDSLAARRAARVAAAAAAGA